MYVYIIKQFYFARMEYAPFWKEKQEKDNDKAQLRRYFSKDSRQGGHISSHCVAHDRVAKAQLQMHTHSSSFNARVVMDFLLDRFRRRNFKLQCVSFLICYSFLIARISSFVVISSTCFVQSFFPAKLFFVFFLLSQNQKIANAPSNIPNTVIITMTPPTRPR